MERSGNPGAIAFYEGFIDALFDALQGRYHIHGVGHTGHSCADQNDDRVYTLDEQVAHKAHFIRSTLAASATAGQTLLLGHSIGCWMLLKVLKRWPDVRVDGCVLVFPTIRHLWEGMNPGVRLAIQPYVRNVVSSAGHYLGEYYFGKLLDFFAAHLSDEVKYVVAKRTHFSNTMNILSMAYTEAQEIRDIDDECADAIATHYPRLLFLYTPNDPYVPRAFYDDLLRRYPYVRAQLVDPAIKHAFVLSHVPEMTAIVAEHIRTHLQPPQK